MNWNRERVLAICRRLKEGASPRQIQDEGIASRTTVRKYEKLFVKTGAITTPPCGCGRERWHNGWCRPRLDSHPKRQRALADLHAKQRARAARPGKKGAGKG